MGGEQAALVLSQVKETQLNKKGVEWAPAEKAAFEDRLRETYERQSSPYYASARLWDDGVIHPLDTRRVVALALSTCFNREIADTQFGVFRM